MKTYTGFITKLEPNQVFVFGSNPEGRHGAGAAKQAMKFGAKYGIASGHVGQTYGIITVDIRIGKRSIKPRQIVDQIRELYEYAIKHPELEFLIAYSGTGTNLNGYTNEEMAKMFWDYNIPKNIVFEKDFLELIREIEERFNDFIGIQINSKVLKYSELHLILNHITRVWSYGFVLFVSKTFIKHIKKQNVILYVKNVIDGKLVKLIKIDLKL